MFILRSSDYSRDDCYAEGLTVAEAYQDLQNSTGEPQPYISMAWRCEPITINIKTIFEVTDGHIYFPPINEG